MLTMTTLQCPYCRRTDRIDVTHEEYMAYAGGAYIQDCFARLTPAQRERFITGVCDECWTVTFGDDER